MGVGREQQDGERIAQLEALVRDLREQLLVRQQAEAALRRSEAQLKANEGFQRSMAALAVCANATGGLEELLLQICHDAAAAFGVTTVMITRLQKPNSLVLVASTHPGIPLGTRIQVDDAGFLAGQAVREHRAVYRNRLPAGRSGVLHLALASVLVAPIIMGEAVMGTIALAVEEPDRFGDDDLVKAAQLAYIVGGALNNSQIHQRERQVAARLRDLERWRAAFLHVMAHELRTPLGQVLGFIDLLGDEADRLSARGQRYLANVRQASGTLERLVQRALDVLDLFAAEARPETEPLNLAALVEPVLAAYEAPARAKAVTLQATLPAQAMQVQGDGRRLRQAISILLDNALKFVPSEGTVTVAAACNEEWAELAIWNSGPAVPLEVAEQIFSQGLVEDSLTRPHGGTGLSLLLARRIAELHGGSLRLDPSAVGARFVLTLPLVASPQRGRTAQRPDASAADRGAGQNANRH